MGINEFAEIVKQKILDKMDGLKEVQIKRVLKNNNVLLTGIVIIEEEGSNMHPVIYLEQYFSMYELGMPMDDVVYHVVMAYYRMCIDGDIDVSFIHKWETLKSRIIYKVISKKRNQELLQKVPYVDWLDEFAIVFYILMEKEEGLVLLERDVCEHYDVDSDELWKVAKENTPKLLPIYFEIAKMTEEEKKIVPIEMYVLSNKARTFGAGTILYPDCLEKIADKLQSSFYILLSSVHELVIIPVTASITVEELKIISRRANESGRVKLEDILGESIYYYDKDRKILERIE